MVSWCGGELGRTPVVQDTLDPVWNTAFTLHMPDRYADRMAAELKIELHDKDFAMTGEKLIFFGTAHGFYVCLQS